MNRKILLPAIAVAGVALTGCSGSGQPSPSATPPVVCSQLVSLNLLSAKTLIDNAWSPNGKTGNGIVPLTPWVMRNIGALAILLKTMQTTGNPVGLRVAIVNEAVMFTRAANSLNGTVTRQTASGTDDAYSVIATWCPGVTG